MSKVFLLLSILCVRQPGPIHLYTFFLCVRQQGPIHLYTVTRIGQENADFIS